MVGILALNEYNVGSTPTPSANNVYEPESKVEVCKTF